MVLRTVVINDEGNKVAAKSVAYSLKQLGVTHPGILGDVKKISINGLVPQDDLLQICNAWASAIAENPSTVPDVVVDTTRAGFPSETVSAVTAALGIPTVSAQFGLEGDIISWQELDPDQAGYLVQIMPPTDLIPEAARQIAYQMNITNAGVIFDEGYTMDHKYKSLFLNVQTRHILIGMKETVAETRLLLKQFRELDIVNYFILGNERTVKSVLDIGQSLNYTGRRYGWYVLTEDDFEPHCECKNLSLILFKPIIPSISQQRIANLTNRGLLTKPVVTSAFYYDITRLAVMAMSASISAGKWPIKPANILCDDYDGSNRPRRNFNFFNELVQVSNRPDFQPTLGGISWGLRNGHHRAKFDMTAKMVTIVNGNQISSEDLGTWPAERDAFIAVSSVVFFFFFSCFPTFFIGFSFSSCRPR